MLELQEQRQAAEAFCQTHIVAMCAEMEEYSATGILKNGFVRELARMLRYAGSSAQACAENMVSHLAIRMVAKNSTMTLGGLRREEIREFLQHGRMSC